MQLINSPTDLASQLLKKVYRHYPGQKLRSQVKNFRIIPSLSLNPTTNEMDVRFNPYAASDNTELEDLLQLCFFG